MKKLFLLVLVGAVVYWVLKDRLGSEPDEFVFAEAPIEPQGATQDAPATPIQ